jgi:hypothetical protein
MLLPALAPLFWLGVGVALWRLFPPLRGRESAGALLLLVWVAGTLAGTSLLFRNVWTIRYLVVFPALMLLCAWGLAQAAAVISGILAPRLRGRAGAALVTVALAGLATTQTGYYFNAHLPFYNEQVRSNDEGLAKDHFDAFYRAARLPAGTPVYLITRHETPQADFAALRRFTRQSTHLETLTPADLTPNVLARMRDNARLVVFIEPEDHQTYGRLSRAFRLSLAEFSPYNVPPFAQYALYHAEKID